ncbi:hypothetical protein CLAFUW4_02486 [Fulvia fulva]|uniref:Uncharacterized protein n=1 Tax=Passalora fulva TaxID=5499 RepID=A0A9Q8LA30_PASFU|nr:uncharacterized protein CLAFUR5_02476 [Fulvia fulva]KAK4631543.1 hypothetical protein CLAFUR4_02481 [Fulvia fulva]KAK4633695.1 hypothetical protein CLAFUR0_02485 [Fulvia fulva]UJO13612.1 hypothetical protein CLAFUR5_02476 [Fulvia fulva]WPV11261.1 hypothetical protein CLAFUW4_02486 [Fulvia fulva]WPV26603.1 hypothetical protein CLAFUW7_02486 [Fulvia fulva]
MRSQPLPSPTRLAILLVSLATIVFTQQCYYPDGITSQANDVPCNASAAVSPCCNKQDMCLDNGLCLHGGGISRGSCTEQSWGQDCPQWCKEVNNASGIALLPCSPFGNVFSCQWGSCDTSFPVKGTSAAILRDAQVKPLGSTAAIALSATDILSAASATGTASNSTSSQSTATRNPNVKYTSGDMAAVGAGIGVPLLTALLGAIFLLPKKPRLHKEESQPLAPESHLGVQQTYPSGQYDHNNSYTSYGSRHVGELDVGREAQELSSHQASELYVSTR